MPGNALRSLTLQQAVDVYLSIDSTPRPATLDPRYVAADARRAAILQPVHLLFEQDSKRWLHSVHLTRVPGTDLFDASSPYGYGGPLASSDEPEFLAAAWQAYSRWMAQQRVVVEYLRFHPLLANERAYTGQVCDNREVVAMDLSRAELEAGYAPRLRHGLRKAVRSGLIYRECALASEVARFGRYYRAAMAKIGADPSFQFEDAYFGQLAESGQARLGLCESNGPGADPAQPWLAACLFLDGVGVREYHLAATTAAGRAAAASSFALHQAALAARQQGRRWLYLGGGSDTRPDNRLLFFKSAYSPQRLAYRTGSQIFDHAAYDELKRLFPEARAAHPERPIFHRRV